MFRQWKTGSDVNPVEAPPAHSAALYVRMSTESQKYSIDHQTHALDLYARAHGYEITETYADAGKSGLTAGRRDGLQRLLHDVSNRLHHFHHLLVYDVSRWGRFQDTDESAYYEFLCRSAGVAIHYCAEQFENNGSISATIIKAIKRAMAGEYSRELSVKVFAGQSRLVQLGFRQGGPAGYGLRRQLLDEHGNPKLLLAAGQRKSLQSDKVILVPGPAEEVETVRLIYQWYCEDRLSKSAITRRLNDFYAIAGLETQWSRNIVHQVLNNEKYIGNNVYNRSSAKLASKRTRNAPSLWVRATGVFPSLIDSQTYLAAQQEQRKRAEGVSDQVMLDGLKQLLAKKGRLSADLIDETEGIPYSSQYSYRFGSLSGAYDKIGYVHHQDLSFTVLRRRCHLICRQLHSRAIQTAVKLGFHVSGVSHGKELVLDNELTISVAIVPGHSKLGKERRWRLRRPQNNKVDVVVAVRLDQNNEKPLDVFLVPAILLDNPLGNDLQLPTAQSSIGRHLFNLEEIHDYAKRRPL